MNNENKSNSRIHFIYCIGILSGIIVIGITYILGRDNQLTKDSDSSKDIAIGAKEISDGSEKIRVVLKEGIDTLGERFEKHRTKTERTLERISLGSQTTTTEDAASATEVPENSVAFYKTFLKKSSIYGLMSVYLCQLSFKARRDCDLKAIESLVELPYDYSYGYISASNALDIVTVTFKIENEKVIMCCNECIEELTDYIKTTLINSMTLRFKDKELADAIASIAKLEHYFNGHKAA